MVFNNACQEEALHNAEKSALNVLHYPVEHILTGHALSHNLYPEGINDLLDCFRIDKTNFRLSTRTSAQKWTLRRSYG